MPLIIVRNDISKVKADAIVNSANPRPICGGGAEYHIFQAAGYDTLLKAREEIGALDVAQIAVTPAFALSAKYIIHTVGPKWDGGQSGEVQALENCYRGALSKALELGCESIAFPLISSGVYKFPKDSALKIAQKAISSFLQTNEMDVQLVVFDRKSLEVSEELSSDIAAFIDDNYVEDKVGDMHAFVRNRRWRERDNIPEEEWAADRECVDRERFFYEDTVCDVEEAQENLDEAAKSASPSSLDEILANPAETFCEKLFHLIQEKHQDDVDVYKNANLDRKHFSKIRSNVHYRPTKKTALALAIALHLNLDETNDLLARAELALSPSNKGDLIVKYFITHGKYDIWEINSMLFKNGQPGLGA